LANRRKFESGLPVNGTASPQAEARGLLRLVRLRRFSESMVRRLIFVTDAEAVELRKYFGRAVAARAIGYRRAVLQHFDALARGTR